jgi:hypothetical protein
LRVTLGTHRAADATCRPVAVALLREDGSVWADSRRLLLMVLQR